MVGKSTRAVARTGSTNTRAAAAATRPRPTVRETRAAKRQRVRLHLHEDEEDADNQGEVEVSSGVRVQRLHPGRPAGGDGPDDSSTDDEDDGHGGGGHGGDHPQAPAPGRDDGEHDDRQPNDGHDEEDHGSQHSTQDDDLEAMTWWDVLTPGQQRSMMKRFLVQPPTPVAAAPPPVVPVPVPRREKRKKLLIDDFHGRTDESVEAWLATISQEVQRQMALGGDTWTSRELYFGVTAKFKGAASKWFTGITDEIGPDDRTLEFITMRLRQKYGRRENAWQIQERLSGRPQQGGERLDAYADVLTNISFGKRVTAETLVEAFLNGMNNQVAAAQVRAMGPRTLEEAVQGAVHTNGEYGEGRKVTDWREAKRLYRTTGTGAEKVGGTTSVEPKADVVDEIDWSKLGLGFGGSEGAAPVFDDSGREMNSVVSAGRSAKEGALPLAALQAIAVAAGVGQVAAAQKAGLRQIAAGKLKVAKALEVLAAEEKDDVNHSNQGNSTQETRTQGTDNTYQGGQFGSRGRSGFSSGRGFQGGRWSSFGSGRGGFNGGGRGGFRYQGNSNALQNYGPQGSRPIAQLKKETLCGYCYKPGHWWRECALRSADNARREQQQQRQVTGNGAPNEETKPATTNPQQGNENRQ